MSRKIEIQQQQWIPVIFESYLIYETLNTFEIVKHSGGIQRILNAQQQIDEIIRVIDLFSQAKLLLPKGKESKLHFGITFDSYTYEVTDEFKHLVEESIEKANNSRAGDIIQNIKIENITNNTVKVSNFNLSFVLEKIFEIKASLF